MNKNIVSTIFTILALVFIIIALFGVWYSGNQKISLSGFEIENGFDIHLNSIEGRVVNDGGDLETQSESISELREQYKEAGMDTGFLDVIDTTFIITIIGLVFAILAFIFAALSFFKPKIQKIAGILSILLFVFALIAPIYFMIGYSDYLDEQIESWGTSSEISDLGFWYSKSVSGGEISMGPGYAWYLILIGAVFGLIAAITLFLKQKVTVMS